jgi:hypothetical protein
MISLRTLVRAVFVIAAAGLPCGGVAACQAADAAWEWSPYRVQFDFSTEASPQLDEAFASTIREAVIERLRESFAGAWQIDVVAADPAAATIPFDKRFDVRLSYRQGLYQAEVIEQDTATATASPTVVRKTPQRESAAETIAAAVRSAFRPLVQIDDLRGSSARLRFRAAAAAGNAEERKQLTASKTFVPYFRRLDRDGKLQSIEPVPWTLLAVEELRGEEAVAVVASGRHDALGVRRRGRSERIAVAAGEPTGTTTLRITTADGRPLAGCRVYADDDGTAAAIEEGPVPGTFTLTADRGRMKRIVVTTRFVPLAKFPLVPGLVAELVVPVSVDPNLLAAEERLVQWQSAFLDLHIRRRMLLTLASSKLEQEQPDAARTLLGRFEQTDRPAERIAELKSLQRRLAAEAGVSRTVVERMFADAAEAAAALDDAETAAEIRKRLQAAIR